MAINHLNPYSMKLNNYLLSIAAGLTALAVNAQTVATPYNYTGGIQTFTVPCGVDSVYIQAWGAQGADGAQGSSTAGATPGGTGGLGGYADGWLAVTEGQVLNIFVGGIGSGQTGGFNGGGNGGSQSAGGGGGASDVRVNGTAEADRVITAGGGGGGGRGGCESQVAIAGGNGGTGGGGNGADGENAPTSGGDAGGGFGAIGAAGGAAGIGCSGFLGSPGNPSSNGTGGVGGAGQTCCCFSFASIPGGGGGGGGQVGGGGGGGGSAGTTGCSGNDKGAGGGGAGGTSYTGGVVNGTTNNGIWLGNGMVSISYEDPTPSTPVISASALSMCENTGMISLTTPADPEATFYVWSVDAGLNFISGQNTDSIAVGAMAAGTYTISVVAHNDTCAMSAADTISITVTALPTVVLSVPMDTVCAQDGPFTLSGESPAGGTWSGTAVTGSDFDPSLATSGAYNGVTYMYTDSNGCSASAMDSVWVDVCMGISSAEVAGVSVSPNPATDMITVTWSSKTQVSTIKVMDVTGRVVMTETNTNANAKQINISTLPAGTYTLSIEGETGKSTQTFLKK